ncbi:hypothetical protein RRG08_065576 [Elysia crispata]|uniref:Uncharacterized protein n=1 Tax=Elysia crispata TaxID=231223 RepID=A0AAE1D2A4_9GAST|nr:hypothetical protein RRG08_065576 [Elysia crispata]
MNRYTKSVLASRLKTNEDQLRRESAVQSVFISSFSGLFLFLGRTGMLRNKNVDLYQVAESTRRTQVRVGSQYATPRLGCAVRQNNRAGKAGGRSVLVYYLMS